MKERPDLSKKENSVEQESGIPEGRIFLFRHGDTEYQEEFPEDPSVQKSDDLTRTGRKQVRMLGTKISEKTQENETVNIIASPRVRAQNTADIVQKELPVDEDNFREFDTLSDYVRNAKFLDEEGNEIKYSQDRKEREKMKEIIEPLYKQDPEKLQKEHVEDDFIEPNLKELLRRLVDIARHRSATDEKMLISSHGEVLDILLQEFFSLEESEDGIASDYADLITIEVYDDSVVLKYKDKSVDITKFLHEQQ